jgi:hypothetical protein
LPFCQLAILSTCHFVYLPLCLLATLSTCHFVYLPLCLLAILSTCHFVNLPFCQLAILSTCHFINLPFCQLAILSTCHEMVTRGNLYRRGRFSTIYRIKEVFYIKSTKNNFNIKSNWSELVSTRRSTVLSFPSMRISW